MVSANPETVGTTMPRFIYITGCDGTGKTTQVRLLLEQLKLQGIIAKPVWLRFPFLVSLPLLAYARWRKLSWYEQSKVTRHGYWNFRKSHLLRRLLPWTLLLDATISSLIKIYLPLWRGETVVCERFVLDMLVDMSVAFDCPNMQRSLPGKLFLGLLPRGAKVVILELDPATIRKRREAMIYDQGLESRLKTFQSISKDLNLPVFSSRYPAHELNLQIRKEIICIPG
jgi:hypothetical protein